MPATAVDHAVHAPLSRAVEAIFGYLEPLEPVGLGGGGVVDLGPDEGLVLVILAKHKKLTCRRLWDPCGSLRSGGQGRWRTGLRR